MNDVTKFRMFHPEKPKSRGRPQRHYHHLLQEEKELKPLTSLVHQILPTENAASVCLSGSRLAHLYNVCFAQDTQETISYAAYFVSYADIQLHTGEMARS